MRKMEWCFSTNFTSHIENYLRLDGEKRQLPLPVFNSRYAIDLLHKLVDDILFFLCLNFSLKIFFRFSLFSLTPVYLSMKKIRMNTILIGVIMNLLIHLYN